MTTETKTQFYRVTLKTMIDLEIEVEAENPKQAKAKADNWQGCQMDGYHTIGPYMIYHDDDTHDLHQDDNEMYWSIVDVDFHEYVGEPLELDEDEDETQLDQGGQSCTN